MGSSPSNLKAGLALSVPCAREIQVPSMPYWSGTKAPPFMRLNIYFLSISGNSSQAFHIALGSVLSWL